tara:strand:- start:8454 stop:8765 length:312 start_codon:yes stop_codon:yes gene_type:complete
MTQLRERRGVLREIYPTRVTFDDLNEPLSVRYVDPGDLASVFGPGYRWDSMTIEITDEPLAQDPMAASLPWLNDVAGGLHGGTASKGAPLGLQGGDFVTGLKK